MVVLNLVVQEMDCIFERLARWVIFSAGDILKYCFLVFPENKFWHFIQIVRNGENLHEMSNPALWEKNKKNIINLSSAEFVQRAVKKHSTGEIMPQ